MVIDVVIATSDSADEALDYRLSRDAVLLLVRDGTARLLDLNGSFFALSRIASSLLVTTLQAGSDAATRLLATTYAVDQQRVRSDLAHLLRALEARGAIRRTPRKPETHRLRLVTPWVLSRLCAIIRNGHLPFTIQIWLLLTLTYVSIRLVGWPRTVAAWQQPRQARHALVHGVLRDTAGEQMRRLDARIRDIATSHILPIECKERALCSWVVIRETSPAARLVIGVDLFPLRSHCWCQVTDLILGDDSDRCGGFTPVVTYA